MSINIPAFTITGFNAYWFVLNIFFSIIGIISADNALRQNQVKSLQIISHQLENTIKTLPTFLERASLLIVGLLRLLVAPIIIVVLLWGTFSLGNQNNGTASLIVFHIAAAIAGIPLGQYLFQYREQGSARGQWLFVGIGLLLGFVGLLLVMIIFRSSTQKDAALEVPPPPRLRDLPPEQRQAIIQRRIRRGCVYVIATAIALWILIPIWLIFTMAFSTVQDVRAFPKHWFPEPFSSDTIQFFLDVEGIPESTLNSILVAFITLALSTAIATPTGYAIARFVFWGRDATRIGILAVRAFPVVILAVPLAVTFINWGIFDTVWAVALVHTALTLPTTILVVASVFASVPRELEEAAKVFGCNSFQAFRQVVLPLALPGIAASAIFTFVMSWNEVFAAILLTLRNRTLPAEILYSLDKAGDPFKFAGGFFMLVPSMIFIFYIRRYLFNMWGQITK